MQCDSCGEEFEEKDLKEYKIFGKKNYICKNCKAAMYE